MMAQNTQHEIIILFTSILIVPSQTSDGPLHISFFSFRDVLTEEILVFVSLSKTQMKIYGYFQLLFMHKIVEMNLSN